MTIDFRQACIATDSQVCRIEITGHPVMTPAKHPLELPTRALADAVLVEWQRQEENPDPADMPLTRLCNSAIDHVIPRRDAVISEITGYGKADLLCYRVSGPDDLRKRQEERWQPLLDWCASEKGCALAVTEDVMPLEQPEEALETLQNHIASLDGFSLAGLHAAACAARSTVIALALYDGRIDPETAHSTAFLDEIYQAEIWGEDQEQTDRLARMREELYAASEFMTLCRSQ